MPLSLKVFELTRDLPIGEIARRLEGFKAVEKTEVGGREVEVGIAVKVSEVGDDYLRGVAEESLIAELEYRGETLRIPYTRSAEFEFYRQRDGRTFLIVCAKKNYANRIASVFSTALAAEKGVLVELYIPPDALRSLYEERPESAKVVFFEAVRLPDVKKLSLYGRGVAATEAYRKYVALGSVWYVVFENEDGITLGIARNGTIAVFSQASLDDVLSYIKRTVLPLSRPPSFSESDEETTGA